jgi:hypothetical protein
MYRKRSNLKMKTFQIHIPYVNIEISAEDKQDAINQIYENDNLIIDNVPPNDLWEIEEID